MSAIYSQRYGSGAPIILIHSFCETSAIWRPLVNKLAFNNEVITIDLPGFGNSPLPEQQFSIKSISELVHNWLVENNLTGATIIGHSLGGYVTLALATNHPEVIKGFGLLHSTAFADDKDKKNSRNKVIDFVKKNGVESFAESFVSQLFFSKNRQRLSKEIEDITKMAAATNKATLVQYMEAMRDRPDRSKLLTEFNKPILFISGDEDTAVPIEKSRTQYGLISNRFIKELKEVGHMGMYEATTDCYLAISQFLSQFSDIVTEEAPAGVLPDRDLKKNLGCAWTPPKN